MKPLVVNSATAFLAVAFLTTAFSCGVGLKTLRAQADTSASSETVPQPPATPGSSAGKVKADKKPKKNQHGDAPAATPHAKGIKEIPIPLPEGEPATDLKIPETDLTGKLLSEIMARWAVRIDNEHLQMKEMKMDLNHPDGKEDFHIFLPTSIFNLKTRIITSDETATIRTQDFELTGEGMAFNTVDRTGRLIGKVRMLVHNLKQVAGQEQPTPKPE